MNNISYVECLLRFWKVQILKSEIGISYISVKKQHLQGFTLLEVLIAMVIVAISVTGIYSLLSRSLDVNIFSGEKIRLINNSFEYILIKEKFPQSSFFQKASNQEIKFKEQNSANIYGIMSEYTLTAEGKESEINLKYFVKQ